MDAQAALSGKRTTTSRLAPGENNPTSSPLMPTSTSSGGPSPVDPSRSRLTSGAARTDAVKRSRG